MAWGQGSLPEKTTSKTLRALPNAFLKMVERSRKQDNEAWQSIYLHGALQLPKVVLQIHQQDEKVDQGYLEGTKLVQWLLNWQVSGRNHQH